MKQVPRFPTAYIVSYFVASNASLYDGLSGKSKTYSMAASGSISKVAMLIKKVINKLAFTGKLV